MPRQENQQHGGGAEPASLPEPCSTVLKPCRSKSPAAFSSFHLRARCPPNSIIWHICGSIDWDTRLSALVGPGRKFLINASGNNLPSRNDLPSGGSESTRSA